MRRYLILAAVGAAAAALMAGQLGCGGGAGLPAGDTGSIALGVIFPPRDGEVSPAAEEGLPDATNSVRITITGGDPQWQREALLVRPAGGGTVQTQLDNVPVGPCRIVAVAYASSDGTGQPIGEAQTTATVSSGHTTNVSMTVDTLAVTVDIPASLSLEPGDAINVTPVALDADGVACINVSFAWTNTAPAVVNVPATGSSVTFTALVDGAAQVTVTDARSGEQDTCAVTVLSRAVDSVALVPPGADLFLNGNPSTVQIDATALDSGGQPIGYAVISFESGSDAVATVSAGGLVTAQGEGATGITVTATTATGSAQAICPVTVTDVGKLGIVVR